MEDFVRKTQGVRDISALPLDTNHELDIVSDVKGKIYIKILNRYKELLFDNGTDQWVIDMLNNLEVDVEQLKEDILDIEQVLSELPMIEDKLATVETKLTQINTLFAQMQIDVQGLDLRTAELEREVAQLALKDQELLDKINNLDLNVDLDILYSNSNDFGDYDSIDNPNLLDAPYYLSKLALGKNIANNTAVFPISTSDYLVYSKRNIENYEAGQTYTLTLKGTKPSTQSFTVFIMDGTQLVGTMKPVEGKVDEWKLTFTVGQDAIDAGSTNLLQVYQYPSTTKGTVKIDWLKIEKGDTRTPNIPYHKYVGINLKESKNPNDYEWIPLASAAETVDDRLTKTISTYDTVNALQNNRLTALESKVVDTTWQNVAVTEPFTSVTQPQVKKQNGIVYMRGTISNGTGDCFILPEGFRPPTGAYEMQFRLPCRSTDAADYATMYVRPSGLCSIAGVNGTKPIFLSGIIFSTT